MNNAIIYISTLHKTEKEVEYKIKDTIKNLEMVYPELSLYFVKHEYNDKIGIEIIK